MEEKTVVVSGGFDPLHVGHMRMIEEARKLGDKLIVILNNDAWLRAKKGFVFMSQDERKELLLGLRSVDEVVFSSHTEHDQDRSVARDLEKIKPTIFANGGDRDAVDAADPNSSTFKEMEVCKRLGIETVFNIGTGGKVQSSSWLTNATRMQGVRTDRPWGYMVLYAQSDNFWLKALTLYPGKRTSLQKHTGRGELWMCIDGEVDTVVDGKTKTLKPFEFISFNKGVVHRIGSQKGGSIIEVGFGDCYEEDNIRIEDDFGRVE